MDAKALFASEFDAHQSTTAATREALADPFARLLGVAAEAVRGGGKIMLFGNGGSAADAQHIATELTIRYVTDRPAIAAMALTTDSSALTAAGNDLGFDQIFARQVEALGRAGDLAIGISTSGNSQNVILALQAAKGLGAAAAAFGGRDGGRIRGLADPYLVVPSDVTARIQEMHILLGHLLCAGLERELGLA